jgi:hypothetical protein
MHTAVDELWGQFFLIGLQQSNIQNACKQAQRSSPDVRAQKSSNMTESTTKSDITD